MPPGRAPGRVEVTKRLLHFAILLWADYRAAQADTPGVAVQHSVVVGEDSEAARMLIELIGQNPSGVLIVMGTHGRTGLSRLIWGNRAEEVVRTAPCAVLVVKEPAASSL
jgi:nucleotide-binding universal stress UspA family protein